MYEKEYINMKTNFKFRKKFIAIIIFLGCVKLYSNSITTFTFVNPCQPFAMIAPIPNTYGCFSFSITNAGLNDPNSYYSWDFGDGSTAKGKYVYHCYNPVSATTIFTITASYNSPAMCGPIPTTMAYTLSLSPPSQSLCVNNTPSITLAVNSVTVWTGVTIPETQFSFNYGDGTPVTNINTHQYINCNNYIVKVYTYGMNSPQTGCYSYAAVNMECENYPVTGIDESSFREIELSVFPNPVRDYITVKSNSDIELITVADITGRQILIINKPNSNNLLLNTNDLAPGTYFMNVKGRNNSEKKVKFIRE
jgi:hypothetical protein